MPLSPRITVTLQRLIEFVSFGLLRQPLLDRLLPRLAVELERHLAVVGAMAYAPNRVVVSLSSQDWSALAPLRPAVRAALEADVESRAASRGWVILGDSVEVSLREDGGLRGGGIQDAA